MVQSLLVDNEIQINLYYTFKATKSGQNKAVVLKDEKAKEMMESEDDKEEVGMVETTWKVMSWKEQNDITKGSTIQTMEGQEIDWMSFRDKRLKTCLIGWNLKDKDEKPVILTHEAIDSLPSDIVNALLIKFDELTSLTGDEEKN